MSKLSKMVASLATRLDQIRSERAATQVTYTILVREFIHIYIYIYIYIYIRGGDVQTEQDGRQPRDED